MAYLFAKNTNITLDGVTRTERSLMRAPPSGQISTVEKKLKLEPTDREDLTDGLTLMEHLITGKTGCW